MSRPSSICHCGSKRHVAEHDGWFGYHCPKCHDGGAISKKGKGGNVHRNFSKTQRFGTVASPERSVVAAPQKASLDKAEQFFQSAEEKARLNSRPNFLSEGDDKYFCSVVNSDEYGFKAIEIFQNEIQANLVAFAFSGNTILYRTLKYWYKFTLNTELNIIEMACFEIGTENRWDSWMNKHSCDVGGEFLKSHADKRVNTVL